MQMRTAADVGEHARMAQPSKRLVRRISEARVGQVVDQLLHIPETRPLGSHQDAERLQACIVLSAQGDYQAFLAAMDLSRVDWRDALVGAGLGDEDWPERLDAALGNR